MKNCITNAETILSYDPLLHGAIRYNELTQRVDIVKDLGWERRSGSGFTDNDLDNIHLYCERTYGITSKNLIEEAINIVSNRNAFHPVRDFLNSLEWDQTPRVRYALRHFLGADESEYTYEILKFLEPSQGCLGREFFKKAKLSSFFRLVSITLVSL